MALNAAQLLGGAVRNVVRTDFVADTSDIQKGASAGSSALEGLAKTVLKVGAAFAFIATGAFVVFLKRASDAASRAQEVQNLFDVSFGDMASAAEDWAQRTEAAVGVNDTTLKEFSGTLFNMTTSMGLTREGAFQLSTGFTQLALDTSSFFDIPFDQAFDKIRAGLTGEAEPLKQLGVLVSENTVKQTEFAQAILATGRQLTEAEKVQGRAIVIAQGLLNAQGDLIRTADSWANATRLVAEAWTNLLEEIGTFVTESPVVGSLVASITELFRDFEAAIKDNKSVLNAFITDTLLVLIETFSVIVDSLSEFGSASGKLGDILEFLSTKGEFLPPTFAAFRTELESTTRGAGESLQTFGDVADRLSDPLRSLSERLKDIVDKTRNAGQVNEEFTGSLEALSGQTGITADKTEDAGKKTKAADTIAKTYADTLAALTSGNLDAAGATDKLTKAQKALIKAQEQHEKQVRSLTDSLGKAGLLRETELIRESLQRLADEGKQLSVQGFDQLSRAIEELIENGEEVPELFREMREEFLLTDIGGITRLQLQWNEALGEAAQRFKGMSEEGSVIKPLRLETDEAKTATEKWRDAVQDLAHTFAAFGIDANSTLGQLISGFTTLANQIPQLAKDLKGGKLVGGAIGERDFAGAATGIAGGVGAIASATSTGSTGARAGKGALAGAGAGAQVGGPIGAIVGAAAGAIVGFFRGRNAAKFAEGIKRDFGSVLSDGLISAIRDSGKDAAFFLADMFREGALSPDRLAEEVGDIFSGITQGKFTKPEAITALESAVPTLIANLQQLGPEGEAQIDRIIGAAESMGVEFQGLAELIQSTFAPATVESMAEQFGKTNAEIRAMGELLGIDIQTDLERIAASVGLTASEFTALGAALETQFGIPAEQLAEFLESTGISAADLADKLGVGVSGGAILAADAQQLANDRLQSGVDIASELRIQLEGAARASAGINLGGGIPSFRHGGFVPETFPSGQLVRVAEPGTGGEDLSPRRGRTGGGQMTVINNFSGVIFADEFQFDEEVVRKTKRAFEENTQGIQDSISR